MNSCIGRAVGKAAVLGVQSLPNVDQSNWRNAMCYTD